MEHMKIHKGGIFGDTVVRHLTKWLTKKTGCKNAAIEIQDFEVTSGDENTKVHLVLDGYFSKDDLNTILRKIGL